MLGHTIIRACVGILLLGAAVVLVVASTEWGSELGTTAVFLMPGSDPKTGLYLAPWVGRPTIGFSLSVGLPLLLGSSGMWVLVRLRVGQ